MSEQDRKSITAEWIANKGRPVFPGRNWAAYPSARRAVREPPRTRPSRAVPYQEPREGKHVFAVLGAGAVHENDRRMFSARSRTDQCAGQLNAAAGETDVLTFLDFDAARDAQRRSTALPCQRGDLARE